MPADWVAVERAIYTWVKDASGLVADCVIWSHQNGKRPKGQHVQITFGADTPVGSVPENRTSYDAGADAGEEITIAVVEVRAITIGVQVYAGAQNGNASARAIASKIQNALNLPAAHAALNAAGLAPFDRGTIQSVPEVLDTGFEPRAVFQARFYLGDGAEEKTTFIEKVVVQDTVTGDIFTVDSE